MSKKCAYCKNDIPKKKDYAVKIYCSHKCFNKHRAEKYIKKWKMGKVSGMQKNLKPSEYIRSYLFKKYNDKCAKCSWNKKNKYTNKIPLQIHHIDGNYKNNEENNLVLLCPNCHSLTENFGSRNKDKIVRPR